MREGMHRAIGAVHI